MATSLPRQKGRRRAKAQFWQFPHWLDLLVLGEGPDYWDGGMVGTFGLQGDLKVLKGESSQLLWCLTDSLKASPRTSVDLIVVETRPKPTPAMGALATRLAAKLVKTLEQDPSPPPPTGIKSWFSRN